MKIEELDETTYKHIEFLCEKRLKRTVSAFEVLKWLSNFKKKEYGYALEILDYLDVYSEAELVELWDERLTTLTKDLGVKSEILISPVADFGKSGTLMTYYIKKTKTYARHWKVITFLPTPKELKHKKKGNSLKKNTHIILVDDFMGSGNSMLKHYSHCIKPQIIGDSKISGVFALTLFSLQTAIHILRKKAPELTIITEPKNKAFSSRGSVFGSSSRMIAIRNFCYSYGLNLFSAENEKGEYVPQPLGYENSQALIIFPYNPPNNTLPIIWSSQKDHIPLYPRNSVLKMSEAKRLRKEMAHYIAMLKHTEYYEIFTTPGKDLGWKTAHIITKTDFENFAILFLQRQKRAIPTICQILGMTQNDYLKRINYMISIKLLDANQTITEFGESIYAEVLKEIRNVRNSLKKVDQDYKIKTIMYLPKQFKGKSISN